MKKIAIISSASLGLALLIGAGVTTADPLGPPGVGPTTTYPDDPQGPNEHSLIYGSDTLEGVMAYMINNWPGAPLACTGTGDACRYRGIGSSGGQRQMEGAPSGTEDRCVASAGGTSLDTNPGCQEISPMSREMNNSVCNDEVAGTSGTNTTAEGLAICRDGLVVIANNQDHMRYVDAAAACPATPSPATPNAPFPATAAANDSPLRYQGTIPHRAATDGSTSYTIGANGIPGWQDVLRVIYFGCLNSQGNCASTPVRVDYAGGPDRCSGNDANADGVGDVAGRDTKNAVVRDTLINNWRYMVDSGAVAGDTGKDCANGGCNALRAAYRRDDSSGTTDVFRTSLGIGAPLTQRLTLISGAITQSVTAPTNSAFCDGGDLEGFSVANSFTTTLPSGATFVDGTLGGDPIRKPCLGEDDLCNADMQGYLKSGSSTGPSNGTMGVVRAIRSSRDGGFPPNQCRRGAFDFKPFLSAAGTLTTLPLCPGQVAPLGGLCAAPYYWVDLDGDTVRDENEKDFNCLNDRKSVPPGAPAGTDGRGWNYIWRAANGTWETIPGNAGMPEVAQWRQNMAVLRVTPTLNVNGGAFPATDTEGSGGKTYPGGVVCQQVDATRNIGCIVGNTSCTIGFAGREAAEFDPYDSLNEAFRMQNVDLDAGESVVVAPSDDNILVQLTPAIHPRANYPFARDLFLNAIGGFENIMADCVDRGGEAAYCASQVAIADQFYNMTALAQASCQNLGFVPLQASRCVGAATTATCGAPTLGDQVTQTQSPIKDGCDPTP